MTETGDVDVGIFIQTSKRSKFSTPAFPVGQTNIIALSLTEPAYNDIQGFVGKRIGLMNGDISISALQSVKDAHFIYYAEHIFGLKMLRYGRIDAVVGPDFRLRDVIVSENLDLEAFKEIYVVQSRALWGNWSNQSSKKHLLPKIALSAGKIIGPKSNRSILNWKKESDDKKTPAEITPTGIY